MELYTATPPLPSYQTSILNLKFPTLLNIITYLIRSHCMHGGRLKSMVYGAVLGQQRRPSGQPKSRILFAEV